MNPNIKSVQQLMNTVIVIDFESLSINRHGYRILDSTTLKNLTKVLECSNEMMFNLTIRIPIKVSTIISNTEQKLW
eukprot:EC824666.1.p3 GENE.EC824666.1~~EC824666.1.p3  ORF type:complete len:76 (-),score=7.31 EC824666.1:41-268(-)